MFKNNFYRLNYLLKCDLVNKYLLKDVYSYPKIKYINLDLSLNNLLVDKNSNFNNLNFKIRIFIIFYLLDFNIPFLKCLNIVKQNKTHSILNITDFKLIIILKKKKIINNFLFSLFVENLKLNNLEIKNIFSNIYEDSKTRLVVPLTSLYNLSYLINSNIFSINFKETFFFIDIILKNKNIKNKDSLLKNLEFFWLI
jgi:hypothetical protein